MSPAGVQIFEVWRVRNVVTAQMSPAGSDLGNLEGQGVFVAAQMSPAGVQILEIWRVRCLMWQPECPWTWKWACECTSRSERATRVPFHVRCWSLHMEGAGFTDLWTPMTASAGLPLFCQQTLCLLSPASLAVTYLPTYLHTRRRMRCHSHTHPRMHARTHTRARAHI